MILIDYSQVCLAAMMSFSNDLKNKDALDKKNLIRHVTLSSIKNYKKKYHKQYGEVVVACDAGNYWRKGFFAPYKGMRKKAREESDLDWGFIFDTLSEIREDIREHFPYKVIHVNRCEADDVIAVLTQNTQEFGQHQPVMIISSDKDFKQLHEFDNVKQYSPMLKKLVSVEKAELREWKIEHIVKGDSGDGIPNILSKDDCIISGVRQSRVSSKRLNEFFEKGLNACQNDEERRNWQRNETLVDFNFIPDDIRQSILSAYEAKPKGDKNSVMNYLMKNRCRVLLDEFEDF